MGELDKLHGRGHRESRGGTHKYFANDKQEFPVQKASKSSRASYFIVGFPHSGVLTES